MDLRCMELPLNNLEVQKASNPYKNPKDRCLKIEISRRRYIVELIEILIQHKG